MAAKAIGYFGSHDHRTVYDMGDGTFRWTHESETNGLGYPIWVESTSLPDNFMPNRDEEETPVTSPTGGIKGQKLARFDLLPPKALYEVAEHYGRGAEKYSDDNWRKGYDWSLSYAAMQRHAHKFWAGEDLDPETGTHHLAAVVFHALTILENKDRFPEYDNRPVNVMRSRDGEGR
jgi:hypothetical protein